MKTVLLKDTNEMVGFPDEMQDSDISDALESRGANIPIADNPSFYNNTIRPALGKYSEKEEFLFQLEANQKQLATNPVISSFNRSISFGFIYNKDPLTKAREESEPINAFIGNLTGQLVSILGVSEAAGAAGLTALSAKVAAVVRGATPVSIRAAQIGSGQLLPKAAGAVIGETVKQGVSAAGVGVLFNGITSGSEQIRNIQEGQAPDIAKVGVDMLKGLSWAAYGSGGAFAKTAAGISAGTATVAGTAYTLSRAEGQSHEDSVNSGLLMGLMHATFAGMGTLGRRKDVVISAEKIVAGYVGKANALTTKGNVNELIARDYVESAAEKIIKEQRVKPTVEQQFKTGSEPALLDYLNLYLPPERVVKMSSAERLKMGNKPWEELRDMSIEADRTTSFKDRVIESEVNTQNLIKDITAQAVGYKIAEGKIPEGKIIDEKGIVRDKGGDLLEKIKGQGGQEEVLSKQGADIAIASKAPVTIPEFKNSKDAIEFGRVNKENKNVIDELKRLRSEEKIKLDKILESGKASDEGMVVATKAQLYREAVDAAEGRIKKQPLTLAEINARDTANVEAKAEKPIVKLVPSEKNIKVKSDELPVGTGKKKESALFKRTAEAVEKASNVKLDREFYQVHKNKESVAKAVELVMKDPQRAEAIISGKRLPPKGLLRNDVYVAMTQYAQEIKDPQLMARIASQNATRMGQEISVLQEIDPHNPINYGTEISKQRIETYGGKEKLEARVERDIQKIKKEIKKPTKEDWTSFIKSIRC